MKISILIAAAATALAATAGPAAARGWEQIGLIDSIATPGYDSAMNAVVRVADGRRPYDQVKLCVYRNPARISDIEINFRDGGRQNVSIRKEIKAGGCARPISLEGGARVIKDLSIWMSVEPSADYSYIKVFAK